MGGLLVNMFESIARYNSNASQISMELPSAIDETVSASVKKVKQIRPKRADPDS